MNIQTIAQNLRRTIAGKEKLLASYRKTFAWYEEQDDQCDEWLKLRVAIEYLELNLNELRAILVDVDACS